VVGSGDFGSALAKSAARRVSKYAATSTMMIMVTSPVSVVTYAIFAGEITTASPTTPAIKLLKALCERLTGQMLPDHSRSHPYQTPASVSVTITIGTTIHRFPSFW
jgi:hypothetical protein